MPLHARQRKTRKKQRRVNKLRYLKKRYLDSQDTKEKKLLAEKIHKISPWAELPE